MIKKDIARTSHGNKITSGLRLACLRRSATFACVCISIPNRALSMTCMAGGMTMLVKDHCSSGRSKIPGKDVLFQINVDTLFSVKISFFHKGHTVHSKDESHLNEAIQFTIDCCVQTRVDCLTQRTGTSTREKLQVKTDAMNKFESHCIMGLPRSPVG
jgi:hypothetical protein